MPNVNLSCSMPCFFNHAITSFLSCAESCQNKSQHIPPRQQSRHSWRKHHEFESRIEGCKKQTSLRSHRLVRALLLCFGSGSFGLFLPNHRRQCRIN